MPSSQHLAGQVRPFGSGPWFQGGRRQTVLILVLILVPIHQQESRIDPGFELGFALALLLPPVSILRVSLVASQVASLAQLQTQFLTSVQVLRWSTRLAGPGEWRSQALPFASALLVARRLQLVQPLVALQAPLQLAIRASPAMHTELTLMELGSCAQELPFPLRPFDAKALA